MRVVRFICPDLHMHELLHMHNRCKICDRKHRPLHCSFMTCALPAECPIQSYCLYINHAFAQPWPLKLADIKHTRAVKPQRISCMHSSCIIIQQPQNTCTTSKFNTKTIGQQTSTARTEAARLLCRSGPPQGAPLRRPPFPAQCHMGQRWCCQYLRATSPHTMSLDRPVSLAWYCMCSHSWTSWPSVPRESCYSHLSALQLHSEQSGSPASSCLSLRCCPLLVHNLLSPLAKLLHTSTLHQV